MFSPLTTQLRSEVETVIRVLDLMTQMREWVYSADEGHEEIRRARQRFAEAAPTKAVWQLYDHGAALMRLYAVFEQFVEGLVAEYLGLLPRLYDTYAELPEPIKRHHRVGLAQILQKVGRDGGYRDLKEDNVVADWAHGLTGGSNYKLNPAAFFVDRQNYRFGTLLALFGRIGLDRCGNRLVKHPLATEYLAQRSEDVRYIETTLDEFVEYRNDAVHSQVEETVAVDNIREYAALVLLVSEILAQLAKEEIFRREVGRNRCERLGTVTELHYRGAVAIMKAHSCKLTVGDEIVLGNPDRVAIAHIKSLQVDNKNFAALSVNEGQEIGLGLDRPCFPSANVLRVTAPAGAPAVQLILEPESLPTTAADTDGAPDVGESEVSSESDALDTPGEQDEPRNPNGGR